MPAVVPLVVGYVVGELAGSALVGAIASAAASAAIAQQQKRRDTRRARDTYNNGLRDQTLLVKGGINPRPVVYGRAAVGGQLLYAETVGTKKEHLLMVVGLAHGEVDAIETIYFNEVALTLDGANQVTNAPYYRPAGGDTRAEQVIVPGSAPYQVTLAATPATGVQRIQDGFYGWGGGDGGAPPLLNAGTDYTVSGAVVTFNSAFAGHPVQVVYDGTYAAQSYAAVWRYTGAPGQDISSTMLALGAPSWTTADKCRGMALLVVRLTFADDMWPSGIPNIKAVIRGRKVYDPRSGLTAWSENAALCARDYLTLQYGVNAAGSRIDDAATIAAASICDEDVQTAASPATYQDCYTFNGVANTGDDRRSNLALFENAMAGRVNYSAGKWRIRAGAWALPALTLDASMLSAESPVQIVPFATRRDLVNGAKGTYLNAAAGYIEDAFPEWSSSAFIAEDGGAPLTVALTLRGVTDPIRAQRLAKIAVYRSREQLTLSVACNFKTYLWQVGDMVSVTLARYGFSAKPFRIAERAFDAATGMRFTLREEPNGIYDWNFGEASILTGAGNTTLPNPAVVGVPTITGITSAQWLYKAGDGTFVARIRVAVTPPNDQYVQQGGKLQLQYKRGDWSGDWTLLETDGNATAIWIDPAFDSQNYLIRVRAKNNAGYVSAWTAPQIHTCQGRPGQIVNLCLNSDFTEDIGNSGATYPDARALRFWSAGASGITAAIGRNYAGGTAWNIGKGGAYMYEAGRTVGAYQYVRQFIPVYAGVAYEVSVAACAHRAFSRLELWFCNSAGTRISAGVFDTVSPGNAIIGDPFNTSTHPRLWLTGTSPVGTVYLEVVVLKGETALGAGDSYAFWSKVMVCVAPSGVTRATATPWVSDLGSLLGQRMKDSRVGFGAIDFSTGGNSTSPPDFNGQGAAFTATFTGWVDIEMTMEVEVSSAYQTSDYADVRLGYGPWNTSTVLGYGLYERFAHGSQVGKRNHITANMTFQVTAGTAYFIGPYFTVSTAGPPGYGIFWYYRYLNFSIREYRS